MKQLKVKEVELGNFIYAVDGTTRYNVIQLNDEGEETGECAGVLVPKEIEIDLTKYKVSNNKTINPQD